jgi:small subunit ribosomal protein S18
MAKTKSPRRAKPKDGGRRGKKKISPLSSDQVDYVDYKDVDLLRRFVSDRAKIRGRRITGNDSQQQRLINTGIKNAREMGLLPYTSRVTTQRRTRPDRGDRPERGDRPDRRPQNESDTGLETPVEAESTEEG